jgi:hypothetical protein
VRIIGPEPQVHRRIFPEHHPSAYGRQLSGWKPFGWGIRQTDPDPPCRISEDGLYRRDALRILTQLEISLPELPDRRVIHSIQFHTVQGIDERTRERSVRGHHPYDPVQASLPIEVADLEGQPVRCPDSAVRGPGESFSPPPSTHDVDRQYLTGVGALDLDGAFRSGNRSEGGARIAVRRKRHHLPRLTDSPLVPQILLRGRRSQDRDTTLRG